MSFQINNQMSLVLEECIQCGCTYAVTSQFQSQRKDDKRTFYCPNGHPQSYTKSTASILQEKLNKLESELTSTKQTSAARLDYMQKLEKQIRALEKKPEKKAKTGGTTKK
jgi:hypothetical protein